MAVDCVNEFRSRFNVLFSSATIFLNCARGGELSSMKLCSNFPQLTFDIHSTSFVIYTLGMLIILEIGIL